MILRLTARSRNDLNKIFEHYEKAEPLLGLRFLEEVEQAFRNQGVSRRVANLLCQIQKV